MIKIKNVFLRSHVASSVVPYWKMDDLGGVGVAGLAWAWLAGRASLKMLEPKDPRVARWGAPFSLLAKRRFHHF